MIGAHGAVITLQNIINFSINHFNNSFHFQLSLPMLTNMKVIKLFLYIWIWTAWNAVYLTTDSSSYIFWKYYLSRNIYSEVHLKYPKSSMKLCSTVVFALIGVGKQCWARILNLINYNLLVVAFFMCHPSDGLPWCPTDKVRYIRYVPEGAHVGFFKIGEWFTTDNRLIDILFTAYLNTIPVVVHSENCPKGPPGPLASITIKEW